MHFSDMYGTSSFRIDSYVVSESGRVFRIKLLPAGRIRNESWRSAVLHEAEQDFREVTKEEWNQLLDLILEKSIYKVIILDLGDTVDGLYDLLGRCSKVYTPYIEEGAAKAKLNQYEENLRSAGYGEILKKTVRRRMGKPRNPVALEASASKITEFPDRERKS